MKKRLFFRLPLLPVFFFFSLFSFSVTNLFAQEAEAQVKISIRILETNYKNIDDKGKNKYVWKFYKGVDVNNPASVLTNQKLETCFLVKSRKSKITKEISDAKDELKPFLADIAGFKITMVAFLNKKGGEKCDVDAKDKYYSIKTEYIKPDNLASGVWSPEIKIETASGWFDATIVYKYELSEGLGIIESSGNNLVNDASKNIALSLPIKLAKKETLPFTWSYTSGNEENWKIIPNLGQDKSKIEFSPLNTLFANKFAKPTEVKFKAEGELGGKTIQSEVLTLTFAPPAPIFDKEKDLQLIPICSGLANGGIDIKNIKAAASEIKYVLFKKTEKVETCNFKNPSVEECPGFVKAETVPANKTLKIRNLAVGEYLLYIFNADLESGEVNTKTEFTITELTPFKIIETETSTKNPTCENEKGGEIWMNVDGAVNLWQIVIVPNKGTISRDGNNISFKNLEAGKYTVYLSDQCGPEKSKTYILKKPKQISIDKISPLQDETGFYIQLNVLNGSNNYKAKITDQENIVTEDSFSFLPDIKIPISKIGIYNIEITDTGSPACPPARVKVKVDKSPTPKTGKFKIKLLDE